MEEGTCWRRLHFDVCHDVYLAARETIDSKIPTLNAEASGKYQWRPDRLPRLAEYVCDFARAGERALGGRPLMEEAKADRLKRVPLFAGPALHRGRSGTALHRGRSGKPFLGSFRASPSQVRSGQAAWQCFGVYYLGGAEYQAARRHLGISELTWADWAEEIRRAVGSELTRAGVFPPSKYFRETGEKAS